ncbi:MAG: co-chaperone GroES [SAR202 cluster bacterium Io17-Chloro-G9]|nr:MAG: co-chaperone GroES [SAR202 cluster bacterium Io17-Chloro-G9]
MTTSVTSATQIHPMGDRVVIRPTDEADVSAGGIILPDTAKERPQEGEVVAAGPGRRLDNGKLLEMELKVGDKVVYSKFAGTEVSVEDKDLLIMAAGDVLAKIS